MKISTRWTGLPPAAHWFLAGTFASNIGNGMHTLAAGALLYQQTGTVAAYGAVVVVEQAVTFLMQVVAGPSVDRNDPRRAAMLAELVRGGCICALSLMLVASPDNALTVVLAMTVIIRLAHTFHRAGTFALTPALVAAGDLTKLNSWFSACQQGGQLVGLGATGLIVALWGAPAAFFINGVTFGLSAATLAAVASAGPVAAGRTNAHPGPLWHHVLAGWSEFGRLIWRDVRLSGLIVVSTADNVALILFNLILAPLVWERFAADPAWLSIMAGGLASGAMVASALVSPLASRIGTRRSLLVGIAGQSLCFAALWWIDQALTMLLLAGALGAFNTISWTTAVTAVQLDAPPAVRGRLAMARNALTAAVVAPLVPLVAAVSRQFSPSAPLLLASGLCAIFVMIAVLSTRRSDRRSCAAVEPSKAV